MSLPSGLWDSTRWDQSTWFEPTPPIGPAGWGDDWVFFYTIGSSAEGQGSVDLTPMVVEARWTTDSHSMGDGTFRGDLQPGKATIRFWDPDRTLDGLDPSGLIWAVYGPAYGQAPTCWFWHFESLSRGLYSLGDPNQADTVFTGLSWPKGFLTPVPLAALAARNPEPIINRLNFIWSESFLTGQPARYSDFDNQSQLAGALNPDTNNLFPSFLQMFRDTSPYGFFWWTGQWLGPHLSGHFLFHYRRWDITRTRPLDPAQVVAGPPVTSSIDYIYNWSQWQGIDPASLAKQPPITVTGPSGTWGTWGPQELGPLRAWDTTPAPVNSALAGTAQAVVNARSNPPAAGYLSSVTCQSGPRWTPAGKPSTARWDPTAHVWEPDEVADYVDHTGAHVQYRVTQSSHRLTARAWETVHSLEPFHPAIPLPP